MNKILLSIAMTIVSYFLNAQTGIGTSTPNASAALEVASSNKGFLPPRVALSSNNDVTTISSPATGLIVYNTGLAGMTYKGIVYWDGTEWRTMDNASSINPAITALTCGSAVLSPNAYTSGVPYSGTLEIPYSGGNGGVYGVGTTNEVTASGLSLTRQAGTLNIGTGTIKYTVSGTPTTSGQITFPNITFLTRTCAPVIQNNTVASILTGATIGGFTTVAAQTAGVTSPALLAGYQSPILTIGDFSFRLFWESQTAGSFSNTVNTQIRYNGTATDMQIYYYAFSEFNGNGGITMWGNRLNTNQQGINPPTTMDPNKWYNYGEAGLLFDSSEKRQYTITPIKSSDKRAIRVEYMLAASADNTISSNAKAVIYAEHLSSN